MTTYGLTPEGLVIKPLSVIKEELEAEWRSIFGDSIPLIPESANGQLIGTYSEREALIQELIEAVNASNDPDNATGTSLDAVCGITGTLRFQASRSVVTATLTGTAGSSIAAGSQASVTDTGTLFETMDDVTLAAVDAWVTLTFYSVNNLVTSAGNVYHCIVAGTSGATGPDDESASILDGSVEWTFLGTGDAAIGAYMQAIDTGPKVAAARSLITIESPAAGWLGVMNIEDADLGEDREEDPDYRVRREDELVTTAKSAHDAIRAAILRVDDVEACLVFSNRTSTTNVDGLPPHSVEVLALGGTDADVAAAVFANVAAGIETYGNTTETVENSQGDEEDILFTRADEIPIYIVMNVVKNITTGTMPTFPTDGVAQIKQAIVDYGDALLFGKDAVVAAISAQAFRVDGVIDVTSCYIGTAPAPALSVTIPIAIREIATYSTLNVTINVSNGTP